MSQVSPALPQTAEATPSGSVNWKKRALVVLAGIVLIAVAASIGPAWRSYKVRTLARQCKQLVSAKSWKQLERVAAEYRLWEPEKAAPVILLAEAMNQQGRLKETADLLNELPDDDPMTPPALFERSTLLFGPLNQPIEGAATLERLLKLDPLHCEGRRRLIYFYAFTLQRRKMVAHAYEAIRLDCDLPETYVYLIAQDWLSFSNAFDENSRWLSGDPNAELFLVARALYRVTSKALDENEELAVDSADDRGLPQHRRVLAEYFEKFPQNTELLAYYLREATTKGDPAEVARLLAKVPPERTDDNRFWRYKGWLHSYKGEWFESEECYKKALTINPYDYMAHHQLAAVERRLNHPEQVKMLEELTRKGQLLRKEILQLADVTKVHASLGKRMAEYASLCGDQMVATKLFRRVEQIESSPY